MADVSGVPTTIADDTGKFDSLAASLPKAGTEATNLAAGTNGAFGNYLTYMQNQQTPLDFYTAISKAQGIPAMQDTAKTLQGQIYNTEDALGKIPQDVGATTGNSLVTQAQRNGIINAKSQPLQDTLTKQSTAYGRASDAVTQAKADAMGLTTLNSQGVQQMGDVYKTGITVAQDNAAREMTGFTTDLQNTLNISLQKIARGEAISDENAKMAFDALQKEKDYQNQLSMQKQKSEDTIKSLGKYGGAYMDQNGNIQYINNPNAGGSGSGTSAASYYGGSTGAGAWG